MKLLGHGIDLVSVQRMREILSKEGNPFECRVFSAAEIAYCRRRPDPYPHFAARFAAKEAYGKAVGLGLGASGNMIEVEVGHDEKGAPKLLLSGKAAEIYAERGISEMVLSLSHDGAYAMASVILA
jgi:holo-[acyl-carrier protein] synthase